MLNMHTYQLHETDTYTETLTRYVKAAEGAGVNIQNKSCAENYNSIECTQTLHNW